jgi:hypothetical protein
MADFAIKIQISLRNVAQMGKINFWPCSMSASTKIPNGRLSRQKSTMEEFPAKIQNGQFFHQNSNFILQFLTLIQMLHTWLSSPFNHAKWLLSPIFKMADFPEKRKMVFQAEFLILFCDYALLSKFLPFA